MALFGINHTALDQSELRNFFMYITTIIVDRHIVWKLGKLQSAYNELRFDVGTVIAVHKPFVFRLLKELSNCKVSVQSLKRAI